jgi:hypothetical protein
MPIQVTLVPTQDVWEITVYDHNGVDDKKLNKNPNYKKDEKIELGDVTSDYCLPPKGMLDIKARLSPSGQKTEEWKESNSFPVVAGDNKWP